jgi:signal transduction histidine kinase
LFLRATIRNQIAGRDAEALHATTIMEQLDAKASLSGVLRDEEVSFEAALLASRLKGVIGIRFFDSSGKFRDSFPANIQPKDLEPWARAPLEQTRPAGRFLPKIPLDQVFVYLPQFATGNVARADILEVVVPLQSGDGTNRIGAAQFVVEGEAIALEYARLDRQLALLAGLALLVAGALLAGMLWPVFRKVERLNEELAQQNETLQRANEELALAARASALGAVSAHLMHGLKNPLASLSQYFRAQNGRSANMDPEGMDDSQDAIGAARRMQALVEETLEVLGDVRGEPGYEVSPGELVQTVCERAGSRASKKKIKLNPVVGAWTHLPSRTANLVKLVLTNLVENAIQATPPGKAVFIRAEQEENHLQRFVVQDEGSGFPAHLRKKLFLPCTSTREGGSGIGLAISHRLAEHLGATLTLKESSAQGCEFVLELPLEGKAETRTPASNICLV